MLADEIQTAIATVVRDLIASDHWRRYEGPNARKLPERLARLVSQDHVQLASSGTAALEIVLRAIGVEGREVMLSAYDYPGNFWAIERAGGRPVLVDVARDSWRLDLSSLASAYQPSCTALIVSHLHGQMQAMGELVNWCESRGVWLIEDVCQPPGATQSGRSLGSFGDAAILSFGGGKLISCGRGGAWATSDAGLAQRARIMAGAGSGPYGISELQAAVVLAQLDWLNAVNDACRDYFMRLQQELETLGVSNWRFLPGEEPANAFYQAGWLLNLKEDNAAEAVDARDLLIAKLRNGEAKGTEEVSAAAFAGEPFYDHGGLPFGMGFPGFHRRSERRCRKAGELPHASSVAERTLVLHHSIALQSRWPVERLAQWIATCTAR